MVRDRHAFVWDGGRLCLDLVNTLQDRLLGGREELREPGDLADWLVGAGLLAAPVPVGVGRLREARRLREAVVRVGDTVLAGLDAVPADVEIINRAAARQLPDRPRLRQLPGGGWDMWRPPPRDPVMSALAAVAVDAVHLFGTDDRAQLRICASERCGLRFVDRSANGTRLWCAMSRCGNRAKARAHRVREAPARPGRIS
jgi:predicted RNA-binding Zn ribbon-like protein